MKHLIRYRSSTTLCVLLATSVMANNIQVANVALVGATGSAVHVRFDLSWENSWRGGSTNNWDAAWVYVKFRSSTTGNWSHAHLSPSGSVLPTDATIDPQRMYSPLPPPGESIPYAGAYFLRSSNGFGNVSYPGIEVEWDHGSQFVALNDVAEVRVFAIEMVYVNTGAFAAGSGGTEGGFTLTTISLPNPEVPPSGGGSLGGQSGGHPTGQVPPNGDWPNGYNAFYCMKYEVSQQGLVDFLNTLPYEQQPSPSSPAGTHILSAAPGTRDGVVIITPGALGVSPAVYGCDLNGNGIAAEAEDGGDLACIGLHFNLFAAYLDWAALRPMTELEFEKACRGPVHPLANEYPWGSALLNNTAYGLSGTGTPSEGIAAGYATLAGNAAWSATTATTSGPLRVGIFAAHASVNGRSAAGAGYYGAMELAGNVNEYCVSLEAGGFFTKDPGDGNLASTEPWPNPFNFGELMMKGGSFADLPEELRVSARNLGLIVPDYMGGRGVRTVW